MPIDWTKPVRVIATKEPITVILTTARGKCPILGYIGDSEIVRSWTAIGGYMVNSDHHLDLENVPETRIGYVNFYENGEVGVAYSSKESADEHIKGPYKRIACIRIEYTKGQFDE